MPPPIYTELEKSRIRGRFNGKILCIVTKDKGFNYTWKSKDLVDTIKFATPEDMTLQDFRIEVYKLLKTQNDSRPITDSIYLSAKGQIINGNNLLMGDISSRYGNSGFVYLTIHGENTFG